MLLVLLGVLLLHLFILILLIVSTAASVSSTFSLLFHFPTPLRARGTSSDLCCCVYQTWTVGGEMSRDLWYKCLTTNGGYHCKSASNEGSAA